MTLKICLHYAHDDNDPTLYGEVVDPVAGGSCWANGTTPPISDVELTSDTTYDVVLTVSNLAGGTVFFSLMSYDGVNLGVSVTGDAASGNASWSGQSITTGQEPVRITVSNLLSDDPKVKAKWNTDPSRTAAAVPGLELTWNGSSWTGQWSNSASTFQVTNPADPIDMPPSGSAPPGTELQLTLVDATRVGASSSSIGGIYQGESGGVVAQIDDWSQLTSSRNSCDFPLAQPAGETEQIFVCNMFKLKCGPYYVGPGTSGVVQFTKIDGARIQSTEDFELEVEVLATDYLSGYQITAAIDVTSGTTTTTYEPLGPVDDPHAGNIHDNKANWGPAWCSDDATPPARVSFDANSEVNIQIRGWGNYRLLEAFDSSEPQCFILLAPNARIPDDVPGYANQPSVAKILDDLGLVTDNHLDIDYNQIICLFDAEGGQGSGGDYNDVVLRLTFNPPAD